jgi:CIC family chloride channel protein
VSTVAVHDLVAAAGVGLIAAMFGIALMRGAALCEDLLARMKLRPWLRPAVGGALVGLLAIVSPQVMSSGHGALRLTGLIDLPLQTVAIIFALKSLASVISLGAGFRGGLFFASLLLGALGGQLFAAALAAAWPDLHIDSNIYAIIGMSALAVSVIGGPLTMVFIALESTGDLWLTAAALIAVIVSAQVTRELFGYSFATWRFHLRGETIHSAADVGWIRDLTVGKMMRTDVPTVSVDTLLSSFREAFPLGSTSHVIAVDGGDRYAGIVAVPEAHAPELSNSNSIRQLLQHAGHFLIAEMTIQEAINVFDRAEAEELAVVESDGTRRVVGLLNEAYALRRYTAASDLRRRELTGTI